ncbi:TRGC1 protein, partial [Pandion haliaetus]|nr:TRGC1 protein [Pandion haliaetus]
STIIHWYQHKANKSPQRILYVSGGKVVDDGFQEHRYRVEKRSSEKIYILSINDVIPDDTATYYCAYWRSHSVWSIWIKYFGTGTKLIVSNTRSSPPEHFEILQKKHGNQTTYVCLIEKFYPEVIRVTWSDEAYNEVKNAVRGDVWKPTNEEKYSISSWLTVTGNNEDEKYHCKYQHESNERSLQTQGIYYILKISFYPPPLEENCSTYPGNSTVFNTDHLMHRTAYLVYIVLLLKSSMYYLIVLFFIYR